MKIAFIATPVPAVPLSMLQREYYFYLFAYRAFSVFSHLSEEDFRRFWMLEPINLGLLQLIAFLEEKGIECSFFAPISPNGTATDREMVLMEKILNRAHEFDAIGFTSITASYATAARMAKKIREKFPAIPLLLGGNHGWTRDKEVLETSAFDCVVRKEGELTTYELLEAIKNKRSFDNILGLSFKRNGKVISNQDRPRMDRSVLPSPAYDHLEDNFTKDELAGESIVSVPIARVTPAVGCANNCIWCADYWKPEVQQQNLDRFANEIMYLSDRRNCRYFYHGTHDFFHDINTGLKIAAKMGNLPNKLHWEAQTRINEFITPEHIRFLKDAGCECLHFGIESANQDLLNKMGKNINMKAAEKVLTMVREEGLHTHTYWLMGSPFETYESANQTIETMTRWLKDDISSCSELNILVGYPGTKFYEKRQRYDVTAVDSDFSHYDGRQVPTFDTKHLHRRDVEYLFHKGLDRYVQVMSEKIGSHDEVLSKLGSKFPNFDPAFMEAAF